MERIYRISGPNGIKLTYDADNPVIEITYGSSVWNWAKGFKPYIEILHNTDTLTLYLHDAININVGRYHTGIGEGIRTTYGHFRVSAETIKLSFETLVWIDNIQGDLHFELIPLEEEPGIIKHAAWPGPFELSGSDEGSYTVLPMMQGCIIPNRWPDKVETIGIGRFYERSAYMPWWGQIDGDTGYIAIVETPWDGGYKLNHPAGGPTILHPVWHPSLGKISYARKLTYTFLTDCDYNCLCKVYRKYLKQKGKLVTLEEKALRNPGINELIGSPVIHSSIYYHIVPKSIFYNRVNPEKNDDLHTFEERVLQLNRLKQLGVEKAYLHLDGWGKRGYDNLHPDIIPPCGKAGGWEGMKMLSDTCRDLGFLFAIHDQYRDYYLDAKTYNGDQSVHDISGDIPMESTWYGGEQAYLCAFLAPMYVKRNFETLKKNDVQLKGAYLDVFSVVELDECFYFEHKMTRRECMEKRIECLEYVRSEGILASSEETVDWAVPHMELCHHSPYALFPTLDKGKARGIPVPLFNLVYHDCMVIPWTLSDRGGWGIPENDSGFLHAILNGGAGYLSIEADKCEIDRCQTVCSIQRKVAMKEMLKHEFIDGDMRRQRTTFADGTMIEVDFRDDTFKFQ